MFIINSDVNWNNYNLLVKISPSLAKIPNLQFTYTPLESPL
jgi:hypothetical protein